MDDDSVWGFQQDDSVWGGQQDDFSLSVYNNEAPVMDRSRAKIPIPRIQISAAKTPTTTTTASNNPTKSKSASRSRVPPSSSSAGKHPKRPPPSSKAATLQQYNNTNTTASPTSDDSDNDGVGFDLYLEIPAPPQHNKRKETNYYNKSNERSSASSLPKQERSFNKPSSKRSQKSKSDTSWELPDFEISNNDDFLNRSFDNIGADGFFQLKRDESSTQDKALKSFNKSFGALPTYDEYEVSTTDAAPARSGGKPKRRKSLGDSEEKPQSFSYSNFESLSMEFPKGDISSDVDNNNKSSRSERRIEKSSRSDRSLNRSIEKTIRDERRKPERDNSSLSERATRTGRSDRGRSKSPGKFRDREGTVRTKSPGRLASGRAKSPGRLSSNRDRSKSPGRHSNRSRDRAKSPGRLPNRSRDRSIDRLKSPGRLVNHEGLSKSPGALARNREERDKRRLRRSKSDDLELLAKSVSSLQEIGIKFNSDMPSGTLEPPFKSPGALARNREERDKRRVRRSKSNDLELLAKSASRLREVGIKFNSDMPSGKPEPPYNLPISRVCRSKSMDINVANARPELPRDNSRRARKRPDETSEGCAELDDSDLEEEEEELKGGEVNELPQMQRKPPSRPRSLDVIKDSSASTSFRRSRRRPEKVSEKTELGSGLKYVDHQPGSLGKAKARGDSKSLENVSETSSRSSSNEKAELGSGLKYVDHQPGSVRKTKALGDLRSSGSSRKSDSSERQSRASLAKERRREEEAKLKRLKEEARVLGERKLAEEARLNALKEEARVLEEKRKNEESRLRAEAGIMKEQRQAEEIKLKEQLELAREQRLAEEARITRIREEARQEEGRLLQATVLREQMRMQEEARMKEETRHQEDMLQRAAEVIEQMRFLEKVVDKEKGQEEEESLPREKVCLQEEKHTQEASRIREQKIKAATMLKESGLLEEKQKQEVAWFQDGGAEDGAEVGQFGRRKTQALVSKQTVSLQRAVPKRNKSFDARVATNDSPLPPALVSKKTVSLQRNVPKRNKSFDARGAANDVQLPPAFQMIMKNRK